MFMFLLMILLIGFRTLNNKIISDENLKQSKQKQAWKNKTIFKRTKIFNILKGNSETLILKICVS